MLKIEIIKFEAQDVITTSLPILNDIPCICTYECFVAPEYTEFSDYHLEGRCNCESTVGHSLPPH